MFSQPVNLPVVKYSYSADFGTNGQPFNWKHLTQDLTFVIDSFRGGADKFGSPLHMMRVVQGSRILEELPLEELINQASSIIATLSGMNIAVTAEQLPISALVRSPLLGIRYKKSDGKICRLQLKFGCNADYDVATRYLRELGIFIAPGPAQSRPTSFPTTVTNTEPQSLSCPPSMLQEINNRPYTSSFNSSFPEAGTAQPQMTPTYTNSRPFTAATVYSTPHRSQSSAPEDRLDRPTSAYSGFVNRERTPQTPVRVAPASPFDPPETFERPATSGPFSVFQGYNNSLEEHPQTHESVTGRLQDMPPRRELPWSSGNDSAQSSPQRPNTAMAPPPLPAASARNRRPSSARPVSRGFELDPLPQPTFAEDVMPGIEASDLAQASTPDMSSNTNYASSPPRIKSRAQFSTPLGPVSPTKDCAFALPSSSSTPQDRVFTEISNNANAFVRDNLSAYATQSVDARKTTLNDFMLQHLDDENFVTLVEDMSVCWASIGLGLQ